MENNLENNFVKTHRGSGDLRLTWSDQAVWPETKTKHTLLQHPMRTRKSVQIIRIHFILQELLHSPITHGWSDRKDIND